MTRYANNAVSYAPLYIHSFRLVQPHKLLVFFKKMLPSILVLTALPIVVTKK